MSEALLALTVSRVVLATLIADLCTTTVIEVPLPAVIRASKNMLPTGLISTRATGMRSAPLLAAVEPTAVRSVDAVTATSLDDLHRYHPRRFLQRYRPTAIQFGDCPAQLQKFDAEIIRCQQVQERDVLAAGVDASSSVGGGDCLRLAAL